MLNKAQTLWDCTVLGENAAACDAALSEKLGKQPDLREKDRHQWLAVASSCELRRQCMEKARNYGCDAGFVPAGFDFSQVRALFFDMDHTAVAGETLDLLAQACGVYAPCRAIGDAVRAGRYGDYDQSLRERAALFAGKKASLADTLGCDIVLSPGLKELITQARAAAIPSFLVSSNFSCLTRFAVEKAPFAGSCVNELEVCDGVFTGKISGPFADGSLSDSPGKARFVRETMQLLGYTPASALAFGDGMNDIGMLTTTAVGVGFRPSVRLRPYCGIVLDYAPFTAVTRFFSHG